MTKRQIFTAIMVTLMSGTSFAQQPRIVPMEPGCLESQLGKICVGDIVISKTRFGAYAEPFLPGNEYLISSKVRAVKGNQIAVDRGAYGEPSWTNVSSVIPLASLRSGNSCLSSDNVEICSCDEFEDNGSNWTAIAGLNQKQQETLSFYLHEISGILWFTQARSLGLVQIIGVKNPDEVAKIKSGHLTFLSGGNLNTLRDFKMKVSHDGQGTCLN